MDVSLTLIVIMAVLFACGVYAMMERSLTRVLIGFLLLGNATNLLLLIVMGVPGDAPFFGEEGEVSDPLPQALTLTAIVITFAVSAFLLALIYRSWQLGQADIVEDDPADVALRARTDAEEDVIDDEAAADDAAATTDFVGVQTAPITVLHMRDNAAIHDDAPVDRPYRPADGAARLRDDRPGSPGDRGSTPEDRGTRDDRGTAPERGQQDDGEDRP
ncbi:Na(+)/H(+) antiporter subunit C [Microbacterium sp. NPDC058345]|uniref:Na(+)/H(+) antiporter subunit C n=1 Tax=Microbacterium sp. NPDC058345 TaxID=3346455 RepID=UPI00364C0AB2